MIKIISGTYGYRSKNGGIEAKTTKSAPFSLPDKEEKRMVERGVAEYVTDGPVLPVDETPKDDSTQPVHNKGMKLAELQAVAESYGVDTSKMRTKDEVIAAIDAVIAEKGAGNDPPSNDPGTDDQDPPDGQPPNPNTADPVGKE